MRVLDTETGQFANINQEDKETKYAILSHVWDKEGEQTYEQLGSIQRRYGPRSQFPQSFPSSLEVPSGSPSATGSLTPTGRLTQSEVETLFRAFAAAYGLASPTPALTSANPSALSQAPRSQELTKSIWDDPELSPKIRDACAVARKNGYRYIWIDSCCVDGSGSSGLSGAINSMYKWYRLAAVCYAYLADVPPGEDHHAEGSAFRESRWFGRGWTLQELIAPVDVVFLSEDWAPIGSKRTLHSLVESVTKIDRKALLHGEPLGAFSVAQRLSWAAKRQTTREEDRAYSLLGIFDINMPTLYGEGDRAFLRLQERIMLRIPDQSLFAWGDLYLGPRAQPSPNPDLADTPNVLRVKAMEYYGRVFASSPDNFESCESINTPRRRTVQLTSSCCNRIEYTFTPYGIRTQFQMIPLTRELLLNAILDSQDVQIEFPDSTEAQCAEWYLAILGCEHAERPGYLLGRVCYTLPSDSETDVEFVHAGYIDVSSQGNCLCRPDLFPLSPETMKHLHRCGAQTELKTVYIPHPDRTDLLASHQYQPYSAIKLLLARETRDALRRARGYSAELRDPDPAHPTTQWLTLSKDSKHTIAVEFRHTLRDDGRWFSTTAEVETRMSGSRHGVQRLDSESAPDSDWQAHCHTVSWSDCIGWKAVLDHRTVRLSAAGAGQLAVDLGLDFAGSGHYFLRVDVLSDALPTSAAIESAVGQAGVVERIEDQSPSGAISNEDADGQEEDAGELPEMASAAARLVDMTVAAGNSSWVDSFLFWAFLDEPNIG